MPVNHKGFYQGWLSQTDIVEMTYKAELRLEEQSEKADSCQENLWNEIQLKGPQDRTQEQNKKEWASLVALCL